MGNGTRTNGYEGKHPEHESVHSYALGDDRETPDIWYCESCEEQKVGFYQERVPALSIDDEPMDVCEGCFMFYDLRAIKDPEEPELDRAQALEDEATDAKIDILLSRWEEEPWL